MTDIMATLAPTTALVVDGDITSSTLSTWTDVAYLSIVFLAGAASAAAGVGGGAVYTVLYIILFGLVYEAIPLSKVAVFGTSIAFFVSHLLNPVPKSTGHATRFAYDAMMVMEPATLLGTVMGVLASKVCPYWLITAMMASLLGYSASKTFQKGHKLYMQEDQRLKPQKNESTEGSRLLLSENSSNSNQFGSFSNQNRNHDEGSTEIDRFDDIQIHFRSADTYNSIWRLDWIGWRCCFSVFICFATLFLTALAESDHVYVFGFEYIYAPCGSWQYWLLFVVNIIVCTLVTVWNLKYLIEHSFELEQNKECAILWDAEAGFKYSMLCLAAGFLSALCGVGGSTIKGPILLQMGLHPTLAKATSQLMLLSTVSASALQFYLEGAVPPDYAAIFFAIAIAAAICGKYAIDVYVEGYGGRQSTIVYLLAWYIAISAVLMSVLGIVMILGQFRPTIDYQQLWFRGFCDDLPPDYGALKLLSEL